MELSEAQFMKGVFRWRPGFQKHCNFRSTAIGKSNLSFLTVRQLGGMILCSG